MVFAFMNVVKLKLIPDLVRSIFHSGLNARYRMSIPNHVNLDQNFTLK